MEIRFFRHEAVDALAKSVAENLDKYVHPAEPWAEKHLLETGMKIPSFPSNLDMPGVELILGPEAKNDAENAIRLHSALKGILEPIQAVDRRLWTRMTHVDFYDYTASRWPVENRLNESGINGTVNDRYFMKRGIFRNAVSRLYWIPELTYDENLPDPYEYTRFLIGNQDLINQVDGQTFCRNRSLLKACLRTLKDVGHVSEMQTRTFFAIMKKRGGVRLLDMLPEDELLSVCAKAIKEALAVKRIENGSKVYLRNVDTDQPFNMEVRLGRAFFGKTMLKTVPENLYRLTVGKELAIGKAKFVIVRIE